MTSPLDRWFHPVLEDAALGDAPAQVAVAGRRYVLFRAGPRGRRGPVAAFVDECPHRGAPLSQGKVDAEGRITCPYHGWRFGADGAGWCPTQARADCRTAPLVVVARHGALWLGTARADAASIPLFGEYGGGANGFRLCGAISRVVDAPLPLVIDNFAEDEHVPYVHTRLGWSHANAGAVLFDCELFDDRTEVKYVGPQRASWVAPLLLLLPGDVFDNRWTHRFDPPRAHYTMRWTSPKGRRRPIALQVAIWFVPATEKTTRVQVFIFAAIDAPGAGALFPLVSRAAVALGRRELDDDARLLHMMKDAPISLAGRSLGRYDRAVVHNRKLLDRIYFSEDASASVKAATSANEL